MFFTYVVLALATFMQVAAGPTPPTTSAVAHIPEPTSPLTVVPDLDPDANALSTNITSDELIQAHAARSSSDPGVILYLCKDFNCQDCGGMDFTQLPPNTCIHPMRNVYISSPFVSAWFHYKEDRVTAWTPGVARDCQSKWKPITIAKKCYPLDGPFYKVGLHPKGLPW